jgi:hypothetical protein
MKKIFVFSMATACWLIPAGIVHATNFPLSQYGQIQNVQSYSSNPFYNMDGPYNQRLPVPIYAQGTELNAGECRGVVDSIVAGQCAQNNNCDGLSYTDIRPAVMLELSKLSGHNYVTSCNGYIQPSFEDYKKSTSAVTVSDSPTSFPTANTQTEKPSNTLALSNPFELKDPDWQKNRNERQKELRDLQKQNGSNDVALEATKFPTTYADLSFIERMENDKAGYEPWKDASGYKPIKIETDKDRYQREADNAELQKTLAEKQKQLLQATNHQEWCEKYPSDCLKENDAAVKSACTSWVADGMPEPAPIINGYQISKEVCGEAIAAKIQADAAAAAAEEERLRKEAEEAKKAEEKKEEERLACIAEVRKEGGVINPNATLEECKEALYQQYVKTAETDSAAACTNDLLASGFPKDLDEFRGDSSTKSGLLWGLVSFVTVPTCSGLLDTYIIPAYKNSKNCKKMDGKVFTFNLATQANKLQLIWGIKIPISEGDCNWTKDTSDNWTED